MAPDAAALCAGVVALSMRTVALVDSPRSCRSRSSCSTRGERMRRRPGSRRRRLGGHRRAWRRDCARRRGWAWVTSRGRGRISRRRAHGRSAGRGFDTVRLRGRLSPRPASTHAASGTARSSCDSLLRCRRPLPFRRRWHSALKGGACHELVCGRRERPVERLQSPHSNGGLFQCCVNGSTPSSRPQSTETMIR